jgi:hypothetical protein
LEKIHECSLFHINIEVQGFCKLCITFWLMLCKANGHHYPPISVINMYDSFNRFMKATCKNDSWIMLYQTKILYEILSKLSMHNIVPQPLKVIKLSLHYQSTIFNDIKLLNDRYQMTIRHNIHDTIWFKNVTCGKVLFAIWCVA